MLVVTRRTNESILIGENVRIVITKVKSNGAVSVGIEAPREIEIVRSEIAHLPKRNATVSTIDQLSDPANEGEIARLPTKEPLRAE